MGLLGAVAMIVNARHSDRSGERYWHIILPFSLIACGYAVGGLTKLPWLGVPGFALAVISYSALQGPLLSLPSTFLKGKSMAAGIAAMNTIGMLGGFLGPYWMGFAKDLTGDYQHGLLTLTIPTLVAASLILLMRWNAEKIARPAGKPAISLAD
jgi:ACS family tartrate transporter-like MFS transporter